MEQQKHIYRNYTDQDIVEKSKEVKSVAGLLKALGLQPAGGNFANIKKHLQRLEVDTSHWTGQAWNKNQQLKNWQNYTRTSCLRKHLLSKKGHQCENCKLSEWLDSPIKTEVHHLNGDRTDNRLENLQLLCPNCHSFTLNYKGKNNKNNGLMSKLVKEPGLNPDEHYALESSNLSQPTKAKISKINRCVECEKIISFKATRCKRCKQIDTFQKIDWLNTEEIIEQLKVKNYCQLGRELGVSDNAIRKHLISRNIIPPKRGKRS